MAQDVRLEDNKYRFFIPINEHSVKAERYGEVWREFIGDKAVAALFHEAARFQWLKAHITCRVVLGMKAGQLRYALRVDCEMWGVWHDSYNDTVDAAMDDEKLNASL